MAQDIKTIGTEVMVGFADSDINIAGVVIRTSQTITEGYKSINEIVGESGSTECVIASNSGIDVSISGHLAPDATIPKDGDTISIRGYSVAWLDGVSIAKTPGQAVAFSATAHGRKPVKQ